MYYPTQKGCNFIIALPFLSLRVTFFVDIRCRKFVSLTTLCNLNKNLGSATGLILANLFLDAGYKFPVNRYGDHVILNGNGTISKNDPLGG